MVARGVRSTRGLQEALAIDTRTVQYYIGAAEWLGLLDADGDSALTALGLEYVAAGRDRPFIYARAVWGNPFAADLLTAAGDDRLPSVDEVGRAVASSEPDLAPATIRRRASSIRSLITPAIGRVKPRPRGELRHQLDLPLSVSPATRPAPKVDLQAGREYSPDVYRHVLTVLLDYGELTLGQIRALLDRAGAEDAPIGGYVDMALSRGDAVRTAAHVVATPDAVDRRELVETTSSIILSDPRYRTYLADAVAALDDRAAAIRRDQSAGRFTSWDRRLFGRPIAPDRVPLDLEEVLLERPLETFPVALERSGPVATIEAPFLDVWEQPGHGITAPPYLAQLRGGLEGVNRILRKARTSGDVGLPDLSHRPVAYHGGILHPGEPLPRAVPDTRSLRLRVVMHAPFATMLAAMLLLHRQRFESLEIVRRADGWAVRWRGEGIGELLAVLASFGDDRGWVVCRRGAGPLDADLLLQALESVGIVQVVGRHAVLAERFFHQLRSEAEELEIYARLLPLAETLESWLEETGSLG